MNRYPIILAAGALLAGCADSPTAPFLPTDPAPSARAAYDKDVTLGGASTANLVAGDATVIDFEGLASPGTSFTFVGTYAEEGFTLVSESSSGDDAFGAPQTDNTDFYQGSTALVNNAPDGVTTLTRGDGETFNVASIDIAELRLSDASPREVPFTGTKADGSTVLATFTTDGLAGFETFTFEGFTELTALSWVQVAPFHQFDNIALDPVDLQPQTKDDCRNGGWDEFGFRNQGQCVRFVETAKDSR